MGYIEFTRDANASYFIKAKNIEFINVTDNASVKVYGNFTNDDLAMDEIDITTTAGKAKAIATLISEHIQQGDNRVITIGHNDADISAVVLTAK